LLAELTLLALVAIVLAHWHGWHWRHGVLLAVVLFAGWRVVGNAVVYAMACRRDGPRPAAHHVGPARRIALVLREAWVFSAVYLRYQLRPRVHGRDGPVDDHDRPARVVLLVHGYFCNGGVWAWFVRWFEAIGETVRTVSLEPVFGSIEDNAACLHARLEEIRAGHPGVAIDLVCHSMGGLVARACYAQRGLPGVTRVVTLGTPHHGTDIARIALGIDGRQMVAGNPWIVAMPGAGIVDAIDVTTIFTYDDNLVTPRLSGALAGARLVAFGGIGHLSLLASRPVFEAVRDALSMPVRER